MAATSHSEQEQAFAFLLFLLFFLFLLFLLFFLFLLFLLFFFSLRTGSCITLTLFLISILLYLAQDLIAPPPVNVQQRGNLFLSERHNMEKIPDLRLAK